MFERFTDSARRVVVLAQEEARLQNHNYIGTEHLLLGLIHEDKGIAANALAALDISLEAVRSQVEQIIGHGTDPQSGHIPFTPRAKKALELSLREAQQLSANHIGTEHILLGLIREGEGVATQVLVKLGADQSRVRQQVIQLLADDPRSESVMRPDIESRDDPNHMFRERGTHGLFRSQGGLYRLEPRTRKDRLLWAFRRRVPNFMYGWPTWFRNRRATGLRGDLAYLRSLIFKRTDNDN